jgi:hypothetical protein
MSMRQKGVYGLILIFPRFTAGWPLALGQLDRTAEAKEALEKAIAIAPASLIARAGILFECSSTRLTASSPALRGLILWTDQYSQHRL